MARGALSGALGDSDSSGGESDTVLNHAAAAAEKEVSAANSDEGERDRMSFSNPMRSGRALAEARGALRQKSAAARRERGAAARRASAERTARDALPDALLLLASLARQK